MEYLPTNGLPIIEEHEAPPEVARVYDAIKRDMQMPAVPNMVKVLAGSQSMLEFYAKLMMDYYSHLELPEALISMIHYTIATKSNCTYCSVGNELSCRILGIDDKTLEKLVHDLGSVNPLRIQAIIDFALKVAKDPQGLVRADYDRVRDQGVSDEEILQIIIVASMSVMADILADALQIEPDSMVVEALAQMK